MLFRSRIPDVRHPDQINAIDQRNLEAQTRRFSTTELAKAKHNRTLLLVHGVERLKDHVSGKNDGRQRQDGTKTAGATRGRTAATASGLVALATQQAIELVETLFQRLVQVRWALVISATTTTSTPGVIVVAVSTRFIRLVWNGEHYGLE